MAQTDDPKIAARRLEVDRLTNEGWKPVDIAKKLKVTVKTIYRDIQTLDKEINLEPQYSTERLKIRARLMKEFEDGLIKIKQDMDRIRAGGSETSETTKDPTDGDKKKAAKTAEGIVSIYQGTLKHKEITEKIFGPNWMALANHWRELREWLAFAAKLWSLMVEKETKETIISERERIVEKELMILPTEKNEEDWQKLALEQASGKAEIVVEPEVKPDDGPTKNGGKT